MNNHWKFKYFEKNTYESHINIFRSLEIENYFKQLLRKQGFNLQNYRLNFSNSILNIFLSVYKKNEKTSDLKKKESFHNKKTKISSKINLKKILKNLNEFTENRLHITLKIMVINNPKRHKTANKTLSSLNLHRFRIPEMKRLYFTLTTQPNSAKLLGDFIAEQLRMTKRHNFFMSSLNKSLTLIIKQKCFKVNGIKILIKGRLNNAARSRNQIMKIGKIPLLTKSIEIDYAESTSFTPNGTIGIQVWISQKESKS